MEEQYERQLSFRLFFKNDISFTQTFMAFISFFLDATIDDQDDDDLFGERVSLERLIDFICIKTSSTIFYAVPRTISENY